MEKISTEELRRKLPLVLRQVAAGKTFELTYYGEPIDVVIHKKGRKASRPLGWNEEDGAIWSGSDAA